jgi:hypothetical protein
MAFWGGVSTEVAVDLRQVDVIQILSAIINSVDSNTHEGLTTPQASGLSSWHRLQILYLGPRYLNVHGILCGFSARQLADDL